MSELEPNAPGTRPIHSISVDRYRELLAEVDRVFSPASPINRKDLFAGRTEQVTLVSDAVRTRGRHAVIFGERGVGKTSLANIIRDLLVIRGEALVVKVNCFQDDTFDIVWRRALSEVTVSQDLPPFGLNKGVVQQLSNLSGAMGDGAGPGEVLDVLRRLLGGVRTIFIFDEFDRPSNRAIQRKFSDTIKALSDLSVETTLVLVGVARDVETLVEEHASIDRALVQIEMPRMTASELREVVFRALTRLQMQMDPVGLDLIITLSQGLPHYTHLIARESVLEALGGGELFISEQNVHAGIRNALSKTQQTVKNAYNTATRSPRKDVLFTDTLLACAVAETDELGYFDSSAVRDPMRELVGASSSEIKSILPRLEKFCTAVRGNVLERVGSRRQYRFRFRNPLLQPYVIMRGLAEGRLKGTLLQALRDRVRPPDVLHP
jgi:hypothetical protein